VYLDDTHTINSDIKKQISSYVELPSTEELIINGERRKEKVARVKRIREHLTDDKDLITISAVEKLFDAAQELDFINKQSIYVYLTEISGLEKKYITKSMSKIRKIYARLIVEEKEKNVL
jgi:predicted nuclease of restriction endonuclease-like RecB superfamily